MAYQQWYWNTLMRGQGQRQGQIQYNPVQGGIEPMYRDQGMGMGYQDQYNGQLPPDYSGQMPPDYNNGPLPPLPNGHDGYDNRQMPVPINPYGPIQGQAYGPPQMAQVPPNMNLNTMGYRGR